MKYLECFRNQRLFIKRCLSNSLSKRNTSSTSVLVLNCGSSSIKFQVLNPTTEACVIQGQADKLNSKDGSAKLKYDWNNSKHTESLGNISYENVAAKVLDLVSERKFDYVGHRVVHGGETFKDVAEINQDSMHKLSQLKNLAPLHNPIQTKVIEQCMTRFPEKPQAAVFDTAYHSRIPEHVFTYPVPSEWYQQHGVRRYGFHGTSHDYVVRKTGELLDDNDRDGARIVSCHLGAGCSVAASVLGEGSSRDTSMGFSPLSGVMMGTRCGDIDPSIVTYMAHRLQISSDKIMESLNSNSGFLGISGTPDSRELEERYEVNDKDATLAIEMFCYSVAKTIASYVVPLGGIDAIVFTGGIGEKSFIKREKILDYLEPLGVNCDKKSNDLNGKNSGGKISNIDSRIQVFVIRTNEELMIAKQVNNLFRNNKN